MKKILFFAVITFVCLSVEAKIKPVKLSCEYLNNPSVVDVHQPRLSWKNVADEGERGQKQTAWQIRVASSEKALNQPDLWLSDKVMDNESNRIVYQGETLQSRQDCWWQVRVWDKNNVASDWSEPAFWHMGILNQSEWQAKWIGAPWQGEEPLAKKMNPNAPLPNELPPPAPLLRKEFNVGKQVQKAVAYVTGLGYFEMYLNGEKVGDDVLVPNQTNYGKRPNLMNQNIPLPDDFRRYKVMYMSYDVSDQIKEGANCVGGILGNGFYNPAKYWAEGYGTPRFLLQLHITYTDGTEETVVSDESWKASKSPILMDMVYYGEHYDARLEQPGWCTAGFDDNKSWQTVALRKAPEGELVAHTARTDKVVESLKPIRIEKMYNGNYKIDFGVEISGWVRFSGVEGPAGHKVEIRYLSNTYSGDNTYIFSGKGKADYAARFNWFVFREVEIVNWPGVLEPEQITAEVVNTEIPRTADFETSNPLFNAVNTIWMRSQEDNMHGGIASDCPHRERSAYTGDGQVACVTVMHNYDARNFYYKWIHDIIDAQIVETGYVPNSAPWQPGCGGGVAWGAAICIMPWEFYLQYGSKDILADAYPAMKEYIRYMQTWVDDDGIMYSQRTGRDGKVLRWFNLGDWVAPGNLPSDEMVHTFYFWRCADFASKSANALGNKKEAKFYKSLADKTKVAFHKRFYNEDEGSYGPVGGNIFALKIGVPEERYDRVIAALKKNIQENDGHLDTGIFGTQFFFEVLSENGLHEMAYEAMNKTDEPGYGRWLELGATTSWENWDTGGSHNHPMFGGGLTWYYRKLAGMQTDENEAGYKHLIFKPQLANEISFAKYYNESVLGEAGIHWQKAESGFSMNVTVPVGARASIYVPCEDGQRVTESGVSVSDNSDVKDKQWEHGYRLIEAGSGTYRFVVE